MRNTPRPRRRFSRRSSRGSAFLHWRTPRLPGLPYHGLGSCMKRIDLRLPPELKRRIEVLAEDDTRTRGVRTSINEMVVILVREAAERREAKKRRQES